MYLDKIVVGHSLEALIYAFLNNCWFIQNSNSLPYFYLKTEVSFFGKKNYREIWTKFRLMMSFLGKSVTFPDLQQIRIEKKTIALSTGNYLCKYNFGKCYIFETTKVQHPELRCLVQNRYPDYEKGNHDYEYH